MGSYGELVLVCGDMHLGTRVAAIPPAFAAILLPGKMAHVLCTGNAGLAVNFLMDRDAAHRRADIAAITAKAGRCPNPPGVSAKGALEGEFWWKCERGMVIAYALLAPTTTPQLQALEWRWQPPKP
jgi:hypothetical protein